MPRTEQIHMTEDTVKYGVECNICLRWYVPVESGDPCYYCKKYGEPKYPNRVRYAAIQSGMSLRELSRKSKLNWRTVRLVSQGKRAPHMSTKRKMLRALGIPLKKNELAYIFPHPRSRA